MSRRVVAVLIACFLTVSIAYAIRYGYGMLLPEMLVSLGISKTQAGIIYASYFFSYTVCSPILGFLSDRYDVRVILTVFCSLLSVGSLLMGFASSVLNAGIFFALAGIGHSACWTPVVALVQKWVPDQRRGAALSVTTMGSGFGIALWSMLLPPVVAGYGWRAGWISMGLFGFCVAALCFIFIRKHPKSEGRRPSMIPEERRSDPSSLTYGDLLKNINMWRVGTSYLLVGFTVLVPYTYLSTYATERLGMSYAVSTRLILVIAVSGMLGKLVLGTLSDRWGRVPMMMICGVLLGVGCRGMGLFKSHGGIYLCTGMFGLGFGAVWPVYAAAAPDFFSRESAGSVIGLWTVFLGAGSILSPIICGWTIDVTGNYQWAFILGLVSATLSSLLLLPAFMSGTGSVHDST